MSAPKPREAILRMQPYAWEPPSAAIAKQAGVPEDQVVRFDTNTFPWPGARLDRLPPLVLNEYSDSHYGALVDQLQAYTGLPASQITIGAGADEILDLLSKVYIGPGDRVIQSIPTYPMFRIVSEIAGGAVEDVPTRDLAMDRDAFLHAAATARFTWVCNPNNPTGELLPLDFIEKVAGTAAGIVAVDEAYFEISGLSALPLLERHPNLVIIRTLSKAFALAAVRVGYALAGEEVTAALARVRPPLSVSVVAEALAVQALQDQPAMRERVRQVVQARETLRSALDELGYEVRDGAANFLLVRAGRQTGPALLKHGLVVRSFPPASMARDYIRVTVRNPQENARLVAALAERKA
ncbi:MAG TPA: histidinol-phosphate transaminase [Candidatus Limnocylindrales bacterium]|nr:histidinol-phosphate transaminase [Candidatus Limnocylindrales bacterium]